MGSIVERVMMRISRRWWIRRIDRVLADAKERGHISSWLLHEIDHRLKYKPCSWPTRATLRPVRIEKEEREQELELQAMDDLIRDTPVVDQSPPSAELQLRRMLAEGSAREAATAEVNARTDIDGPARDREISLLWDAREPRWETDEPPELTPEQRTVLDNVLLQETDQRPIHIASVAAKRITGTR